MVAVRFEGGACAQGLYFLGVDTEVSNVAELGVYANKMAELCLEFVNSSRTLDRLNFVAIKSPEIAGISRLHDGGIL